MSRTFQIHVFSNLHYCIHAHQSENCKQAFTQAIFNFTMSDSSSANIFIEFAHYILIFCNFHMLTNRLGHFSGRYLCSRDGKNSYRSTQNTFQQTFHGIELLRFLLQRMGSYWVLKEDVGQGRITHLKRYMHPKVHSSTIYNSQDTEAT